VNAGQANSEVSMFEKFARQFFQVGGLYLRLPSGKLVTLGDPASEGSRLTLAVRTTRALTGIIHHPSLRLGEAYADGDLTIEQGELSDLLELIGRNMTRRPLQWPGLWRDLRRRWVNWRTQENGRAAARHNVSHHYDLSVDLYRRFLDEDLQYSCAYFTHEGATLEEAQAAKKAHIIAKLRLHPGQRILDIGCGWGGMALSLAHAGGQTLGVTLSQEQLALARERAASQGLSQVAQFELRDYRDLEGPFERIVSVGMLEHVGAPNYDAYFQNVARLMTDDGVALIHAIGRSEGPGITQPWIAKYIFPGGYIPALSEVLPAIERAGLLVTDIEILRLHYAETLRCWRERFAAHRAEIATLYDERFCRMWELYLGLSELSFRYRNHMVFQIQLAKRIDAVPIVRDYIAADEGPIFKRQAAA
jgi:cyclopropane-fatty-acyl-phospholipid synthase